MADFEGDITETDGIALFQPAVRHKRSCSWKSELPTTCSQHIKPELIFSVGTFYGYVQLIRQFRHTADVIDVPMGDQDFFDLNLGLIGRAHDTVDVTARIYYGGFAGFLAAEQ
jgi:hypothetical protein